MARAGAFGIVLVAMALAMVASTEVEEVAEMGAAGMSRGPPMLKKMDVQSLKIIDDQMKQSKVLQKEEFVLRTKLNSPPEASKVGYTTVPGYKYTYQSRTLTDKSRAECELVCSTYSSCKSFSYNAQDRVCIWSMSHIKYDPDFTMWAKLLDPSGTYHTHEYMQMPGMRVQDRDTAVIGDTSFEECKYACSKDESCKTFSFNKERSECMKTGIGIHFDDKWIYSEKDVPVGKEQKIDHKKEAQQKAVLKKKWLQSASTGAAREEIEKSNKVKIHLQNSRDAATGAEQVEKAARRAKFYAVKKCVLLQGMTNSAVKRNMAIMDILGKRQLASVKMTSSSEKLDKLTKMQVTKEARQKAVLNAKVGKLKMAESHTKYVGVKPMEADEKKNVHILEEQKVKACHKKKAKIEYFNRKEITMKTTEANAKMWAFKKQLVGSNGQLKKAAQEHEVAETAERKVKKRVEKQRETVEQAEKTQANAGQESEQKMAMDKRETFLSKLKFSKIDQRRADKALMRARETLHKARGNKYDLKMQMKKNKKEWAATKKEQEEKRIARRKQRATEKAKKKHVKESKKKKLEQAVEATRKRRLAAAQQAKDAEAKLAKDQQKKNADLIDADNKKTRVMDDENAEEKKRLARKAALAAAIRKEKDEKQKTAQDELRSKNLLKKLQDSQLSAATAATANAAAAKDAANAKNGAKEIAKKLLSASPSQRIVLQAKERKMKQDEQAAAEKATKAANKKADTAREQQKAAAGLQVESCIFICKEGLEAKDKAAKMEKEQKMAEKVQGGSMSLIEVNEAGACQPFTPPQGGGDCGSPITAAIINTACGSQPAECQQHCTSTATPAQANEKGCKARLPDAAKTLVDNTQKAAKSATKMDAQQRSLAKSTEAATKEKSAKTAAAKPVPFRLKEKKHKPFTYKGCEC